MESLVNSLKFCKDCKYFKPNGAKCKIFIRVNLANNKYEEYPAILARPDPKMCGEDAKFFKSKK